jgi:capsular exopolysaccharide synthesis family protein
MIQFKHPSPQLAARIANPFADQFYQREFEAARGGIRPGRRGPSPRRAEAQRKKVTELANELQKYREKNNMVSLDQRKDIVTERLKAISLNLTQLNSKLEEARVRARELAAAQAAKSDLTNLPYIGNDTSVRKLKEQLALLEVDKAKLLERYLPDHPKVQETERSVTQTRSQLDLMVAAAVKGVESEYASVQQNAEQAKQALAAQEALSLELDRAAVAYAGVEREYKIAEQLLQNLISRIGEIAMTSAMQSQNARIVDVAKPPRDAIFPKLSLNWDLGAVGGLFLGLAVAFLVAQLDDRVRSALDIESHVGLPLLGVLPLTTETNPAERAQLLNNKKNPLVIEGFAGLLASLSLREDFNQLKVFSVTSTIPGEGKSFISYGLASTFAARGERVCLIDCDLRKPTQHRLQNSETLVGVLDVCEGRSSGFTAVVHRNTAGQFDTIFAGGTSREASRALASKACAAFVSDLRKNYDRIIIDTPPVGVVSDVLALLQHCDASLYVIKFGKAKRDLVRSCVARVGESVAPCVGAVLNALPFDGTARYYQSAYYSAYNREYGEYYHPKDEKGA